MGRARMTNDDYYLYNAIATGDLRQAQKMLFSQVTGNGRYSENPHAEYFRHELEKYMTIEVPPALSGHLRVFAPDGINDRLYYLREHEKNLIDDILRIKENTDAMRETGIRYVNSTLLIGPPGTGKTAFAGILAKRLNLPLVSINTSTVITAYLGETSKRIADIFRFVNSTDCVFFMDELDSYGGSRGNTRNDVKEMARVTVAIMNELDNLATGSIVIAATNRPEAIDKALFRRFERTTEIPPLSRADAVAFISHYLDALCLADKTANPEDVLPGAETDEYFQYGIVSVLNHEIISAYPNPPDIQRALKNLRNSDMRENTAVC